MAARIDERLQRAVSDLKRDLAGAPIPDPPSTPRRLGWLLVPVSAAVIFATLLLVTSGLLVDPDGTATSEPSVATTLPSPTSTTSPSVTQSTSTTQPATKRLAVEIPAEGPIFGEETGVLLLLDDGLDGLTAVDPDARLAGRSIVDGQRAGDEQYSMVRVGDKLVVGWSEPHAVDIATRQAVSLGSATIFVPAAEPGRVWMVDSGTRIGSAPVRVWQVDVVTGEAVQEPVPLEADGGAQIGIKGGLALQTDSGLSLWTMETGQVVPLESTGPGFVHHVYDNQLVWCSGDCTTLTVTNTDSLETQEHPPPDGYDFFSYESHFSADGRYVAALIGHAGSPEATGIWILDRETDQTQVVSDPETYVSFLTWTPDNSQLFATSYSYGTDRTVVWRYQISNQEFEAVVLPFGGGMTPVAVDRSASGMYIDADLVDMESCRTPRAGSQTISCGFDY